ncbi:NAD(P)H-dependent oxidoreductase [Maribacter sp. HTCC2170]|uniref:NAD(P)H-dependent oxidoreductase n=1 Tax=Maribacter sp. (strain HTCC2170 / KCCM 42371) TaxID=313603 RepID=UPI00006B215A|nr:NAD(P)H-dependent oxidoreductase [Maribacter sp. HTCC2170]EAR00053.1 nitroreductase [Maribacter sp. HTCC2170]
MELIKNLTWRYATKQFDPSKKISQENLDKLKRAVQLSVSSYGLQLYKILIVGNNELRGKLKPASWGQNQITDASHLFVFCNYTNVENKEIDDFLELSANTQNINIDVLQGYGDFMKEKINEMPISEQNNWTKRQTYIALTNLLIACAELKIDACPMEGFETEKYNEILGLTEKGLSAAVIAPIGYRSQNDDAQYRKKVRKPLTELFEVL